MLFQASMSVVVFRGRCVSLAMIEAERFYDARLLARRLFGEAAECVAVASAPLRPAKLPRWELRWAGHAAGKVNTLELQASLDGGPWRRLGDL